MKWIITLFVVLSASTAVADPHVKLTASQVESDDKTRAGARLLVEVTDKWTVTPAVEVLDVAMGGRRDSDLIAGVHDVVLDKGAITMQIDRAKLSASGTYQVTLRFELTSPDQQKSFESVAFTLARVAPALNVQPVAIVKTTTCSSRTTASCR